MLAHFKHWIDANEEELESNCLLNVDEEDEASLFIQRAVNHLNKEQRYAWFIMAETTMKANNIDISIWGQFGDNEKEKQGKTTEVNNNE